MNPLIPTYVNWVFALTTLITLYGLLSAIKKSTQLNNSAKANSILIGLVLWLLLTGALALNDFFLQTSAIPPRLVIAVWPPLLLILGLFITSKGRAFIDSLPLGNVLVVNTVRIPVELTLLWLYLAGQVPEIMTFEGQNFDILVGLTAPIIYYFGFVRKSWPKKVLLFWNIASLILLANIVTTAVMAAPTPFQQIAFNQPNMGVLYFPFIWLPTFIVPFCLFSHLVALRQLTR